MADTGSKTGVVLVEPLRLVRAGLSLVLTADERVAVLAEAASADEALAVLEEVQREGTVAVVSLGLDGPNDSYALIRAIRERYPSVAILATAAGATEFTVSRALFLGADGYVDKDAQPERFADAVVRTAQGELVLEGLPPEFAGPIADELEHQARAVPLLTQREAEVLSIAARGLTARQIGSRLGVHERTVTTHLSHIYKKTGTSGRMAAIAVAARSGLVRIPSLASA